MPKLDPSRRTLALAAILLCGAADHSAALALAFQNTIVSTYPDGRMAELWLNPDGAYTAETRRHSRTHGRWTIKSDRICMKQSGVPLLSYCTAIPSGDIGTVWSARSITGEPIIVKLVPGRAGA